MSRATGVFLMVIGSAVMLAGAAMALRELAGLYQGVLADPLGQPEGFEKGVSRRMLMGAGIGAAGVPLAVVGLATLRARRRRETGSPRHDHPRA